MQYWQWGPHRISRVILGSNPFSGNLYYPGRQGTCPMAPEDILKVVQGCIGIGINAIYHSKGHEVLQILKQASAQLIHFIALPNPWRHPALASLAKASYLGKADLSAAAFGLAREALARDLDQLPEHLAVIPVLHPWAVDLLYEAEPACAIRFLESARGFGVRGLAGTHYPCRLADLARIGGFGLVTTAHAPVDLASSPYPFVRQERSGQAVLLREVGERIAPLPLVLMKVLAQGLVHPRKGLAYAFSQCRATAVVVGLRSPTEVAICHEHLPHGRTDPGRSGDAEMEV